MKSQFVCQTRYLSDMEPLDEVNVSAYCRVNGKELLLTSFGDLMLMDLILTNVLRPARSFLMDTICRVSLCSGLLCCAAVCFTILSYQTACNCISAICSAIHLLSLNRLKRDTETHVRVGNASVDVSHSTILGHPNVVRTPAISTIGRKVAHYDVPATVDDICTSRQLNASQASTEDGNSSILLGSIRPCAKVLKSTFLLDVDMHMRSCTSIAAFLQLMKYSPMTSTLRLRGGTGVSKQTACCFATICKNHTQSVTSPLLLQRYETATAVKPLDTRQQTSHGAGTEHPSRVDMKLGNTVIITRVNDVRKYRRQITQRLQRLKVLLNISAESTETTIETVLQSIYSMLSQVQNAKTSASTGAEATSNGLGRHDAEYCMMPRTYELCNAFFAWHGSLEGQIPSPDERGSRSAHTDASE